jgi:hypothetical protein
VCASRNSVKIFSVVGVGMVDSRQSVA